MESFFNNMSEMGAGAVRSNAIGKSGGDESGASALKCLKMLTKGGVI